MEKEQLRIGSLVGRKFWNPHPINPHFAYSDCVICAIGEKTALIKHSDSNKSRIKVAYEFLEPFLLTEDWLLNLGFNKKYDIFTFDRSKEVNHHFSDFSIQIYDSTQIKVWRGDTYLGILHCEFVHELQNIFQAFNAIELTMPVH